MYVEGNPKTEKQLRQWVADGKKVIVFRPGGLFSGKTEGRVIIEGPQFPALPLWSVSAIITDSQIVEIHN